MDDNARNHDEERDPAVVHVGLGYYLDEALQGSKVFRLKYR
jgi:hypothetical protein